MYTILINNDNTLTQSVKENIMHRESNVHSFRFLVDPTWIDNGIETDMRNYVCILEYRTPISEKYTPVPLTPSAELYKNKLEYTLPITIKHTAEVGKLELKFIFTWLEMNAEGNIIEHSRKTSSTTVTVIPVEQWSDYCSSADLDPIVEMMLMNQAQNEQSKQYAEQIYMYTQQIANTKYGLTYDNDTNKLTLEKNNVATSTVSLEDCKCEEGVPTVNFDNNSETDVSDETEDGIDNVVEF